jgi:hypothetical protein
MSKSSLFLFYGPADGAGLLAARTAARSGFPSTRDARAVRWRKIATKLPAQRNWYFLFIHV